MRPNLKWTGPENLLGFQIYNARPEKGVNYMAYEPKAGEWRANVTLGVGRYTNSKMVTTGGHLLESAQMICEAHWQNLELEPPV